MSQTPIQADSGTRRPGRPRSDEARKAILDSTFELLNQHGFNELSMEGIAARAGVSKATVYRWWPNKAVLVIDSFLRALEPELTFTRGEPAVQSIQEQMTRLSGLLTGHMGKMIAAVIGAGQSEPEMLESFRRHFLSVRRAEARALLSAGMQAGEVRSDISPDVILDTLYGALYFRLLIGHAEMTPEFIDELFRFISPALTPKPER